MPFLAESLDDEDEVLGAMADGFGAFVELVGGGEHVICLLKPLAALATVEELIVRDKCIAALRTVLAALPPAQFKSDVPPLLAQLASGDWFTGRVSAAALFDAVYARSDAPTQAALRQQFGKLCVDETPMVRRAAAAHLGKFAVVQSKEHIKSDMLPMFLALAKDEQDSVRLLAVENCVLLATALAAPADRDLVLPTMLACAKDASWRVRYAVADRFCRLCNAVGRELTASQVARAARPPARARARCRHQHALARTAAAGLRAPAQGRRGGSAHGGRRQNRRRLSAHLERARHRRGAAVHKAARRRHVAARARRSATLGACARSRRRSAPRTVLASSVMSLATSFGKKETTEHLVRPPRRRTARRVAVLAHVDGRALRSCRCI